MNWLRAHLYCLEKIFILYNLSFERRPGACELCIQMMASPDGLRKQHVFALHQDHDQTSALGLLQFADPFADQYPEAPLHKLPRRFDCDVSD